MTERIHVLLVVTHLVGGIRTYLRYVYPLLDHKRYRLSVVAVESPESHLISEGLHPHDVTLHLLPARYSFPQYVYAVRRRVQLTRPDIVHAHGFTSGLVSVLALTAKRLPLMVTSHGVLSEPEVEGLTGTCRQVILGLLLRRCDVLQSVSRDAEANLRQFVPLLRRAPHLTVIPSGIDVSAFSADTNATSAVRSDNFLYVGRLMPEKGFTDLIDAVELLRSKQQHVTIHVAGDGGFIREYRAEIARRGIDKSFRFLGFVADVAPLLHRARAQVVPSRLEACGLVAMEALVAGCPLIASDCIGLREVTAGSPALTFPAEDARALADRLWLAHSDDSIGTAARSYVPKARERFDAARTAERLDSILRGLASSKAAGRTLWQSAAAAGRNYRKW